MPATLAEVKDLLLAANVPTALERLGVLVAADHPQFVKDVNSLLSAFNHLENQQASGVLVPHQIPYHYNVHLQSVWDFISRLEDGKLGDDPKERPGVDTFHGYTVNRDNQYDAYSSHRGLGEQCQFFILHGDDRHEHEHFFERVAYDLMGHFRDIENPNLLNDCTVERLSPYAVRYRENPEDYRKELLRKLYDKAGLDANAHAPLLDKNLDYFRQQAPRTAALGLGDYVTVFFRLEDLDEAPEKAAETVCWFIDYVAENPLPTDAPRFLFFFSFEFDESYADEAQEVREAVANIPKACVIKEFNRVSSREVVRWLKQYRKVIPDALNPRSFGEQLFPRDQDFYMADVNPKLQQLINDYNESL